MLESEAVETADMNSELVRFEHGGVALADRDAEPPAIVAEAGDAARFAYAEFFKAELGNEHTHRAYRRTQDALPEGMNGVRSRGGRSC